MKKTSSYDKVKRKYSVKWRWSIKNIHQKVYSQSGAAITFALLLFLVCAVVGSLVLAAGMAAAGRMSKIAEMDQRYYSITSAVDFLVQELTGKEVIITRTRKETTTVTITISYDIDGPKISEPVERKSITYTTTIDNSLPARYGAVDITGIDNDAGNAGNPIQLTIPGSTNRIFLTECALDLMFGKSGPLGTFTRNNTNTKEAMDYNFKMSTDRPEGAFTLDHSNLLGAIPGVTADILKAYCIYTLKSDGTLEIKISSGDTQNGTTDNVYTMVLTLSPEIEEVSDINRSGPSVTESGDNSTITETIETITLTSKIKWKVKGVSKGGY